MDTQQPAVAEASPLAGYMTLTEWVDRHAGPFFETKASVDWFVKRNRRELIEADALIPREGRAGSLVSLEKFPKIVVAIFKRRALEKAGEADRQAA